MTVASSLQPRTVLLVAGACFMALTAAIVVRGSFPADVAVRDALLSIAAPWLVELMRTVNRAGDWRMLLPGTLVMFIVFRRARERWWIWATLLAVAPIMEWALKQLVGRPRPENLSLSFPSGHSTASAAFFGAVMFLAGSLPPRVCLVVRVLAGAMIVLVGLARIILRAHWPSDVLAGIALGLALAATAGLLASRTSRDAPAR